MKKVSNFNDRYVSLRKKKDSKSVRKSHLLDSLSLCDNDKVRIDLLVEMVVQLQDTIVKLQEDYIHVILQLKNITNIKQEKCVLPPF